MKYLIATNELKELKEWEKEKKLIPVMIRKYCKVKHKAERRALMVMRFAPSARNLPNTHCSDLINVRLRSTKSFVRSAKTLL